jgi:hypothetical protein
MSWCRLDISGGVGGDLKSSLVNWRLVDSQIGEIVNRWVSKHKYLIPFTFISSSCSEAKRFKALPESVVLGMSGHKKVPKNILEAGFAKSYFSDKIIDFLRSEAWWAA